MNQNFAKANSPEYSNTDLPKLMNLNFNGLLLSENRLSFNLELEITYKVNPIKSIEYRLFTPAKNPLDPPCESWNGYTTISGGPRVSGNKYYIESIFQSSQTYCAGKFGLTEKNGGAYIKITDTADHWIYYALVYQGDPNTGGPVQGSNLWASNIINNFKPNCELFLLDSKYGIYTLCDSPFDFKQKIISSIFELTPIMNAEAAAKAAAAKAAAAKAAADKAAADKAAADKAAADKAAADKAAADKAAADKLATEQAAVTRINLFMQLEQVNSSKFNTTARILDLSKKYPSQKSVLTSYIKTLTSYSQATESNYESMQKAIWQIEYKLDALERSLSNTKITITCIKGKTIKKVTAIKPKCPAGYKTK